MFVVIISFALVFAGAFVIVRWGGLPFSPPHAPGGDEPPSYGYLFRRLLWFMAVGASSGLGAGLLAAGPGGRLVMRLLALAAGPAAQGRITEARQVVGRISIGGTIELFVFGGLFTGILASVVYMLLRPWLPPKRLGGALLGLLLLVAAATRLDPLRARNPDFRLVGRPLLAVVAFTALAFFHGMVLTALAARLSQSLPILPALRAVPAHLPVVIFLLPIIGGIGALLGIPILAGIVILSLTIPRNAKLVAFLKSSKTLVAGRAAWSWSDSLSCRASSQDSRNCSSGPSRSQRAVDFSRSDYLGPPPLDIGPIALRPGPRWCAWRCGRVPAGPLGVAAVSPLVRLGCFMIESVPLVKGGIWT